MQQENDVAVAHGVLEVKLMWPQDNIVAVHGVALRQVLAAHGVAEVGPV
jgi:hypothetical protein